MKSGVVLAVVLALAAGAADARTPRPSVSLPSAVVSPGERIVVRVSNALPGRRLRLYLATDSTTPLVPIGSVVPARDGRGRLAVRLPSLAADVYAPATAQNGGVVLGRGRLSVRAPRPAGFGPLGAPGCAPASPRRQGDVAGTAAGTQLWALLGFNPAGSAFADAGTAAYTGVVGKEVKIVFRMTYGIPSVFYSVAPGGRRVPPVWGPVTHSGSNWARPGFEWGAGFVFDEPGCWRIHAGAPPAQGDVWLAVES